MSVFQKGQFSKWTWSKCQYFKFTTNGLCRFVCRSRRKRKGNCQSIW